MPEPSARARLPGRRRLSAYVALVALGTSGVGLMLGGVSPWAASAPQPEVVATPDAFPQVPSLPADQTPPIQLDRSEPVRIEIAELGLSAEVTKVGLDSDGAIDVPDLARPELTGWFELGPSPGEVGPAAIVGHVDSQTNGAAVFFPLGGLEAGANIDVTRADGSTARFSVDLVESYEKQEFPYGTVFADTGYPALRLITCGGGFDKLTRSYTHNIVVYATLTDIRLSPSPLVGAVCGLTARR